MPKLEKKIKCDILSNFQTMCINISRQNIVQIDANSAANVLYEQSLMLLCYSLRDMRQLCCKTFWICSASGCSRADYDAAATKFFLLLLFCSIAIPDFQTDSAAAVAKSFT